MGYISDRLKTGTKKTPSLNIAGDRQGNVHWRRVFGNRGIGTTKEGDQFPKVTDPKTPVPGGSFGRSLATSAPAMKRLLVAMRSQAPGGWSSDKWAESNHWQSIVFCAGHPICKQLSMSEFQVFHRDEEHPDGKRPVHRDDPAEGDRICRPWDLVELLEKPNNQDSFGKMMYRLGQQRILTGMSLNWMVPNKLGTPMELYVIPTGIAIPQPAINPDFPDGYYRIQPIYPYGPFSSYPTPTTAVGAPVPAQWIIRSLDPHPLLRYEGYAVTKALDEHIDEVQMIDRSRHYKMRRSINPSAVLQSDGADNESVQPLPEEEIERIRAEFENDFQGPDNHGQLYVSSPGYKLEEWGSKPADMEYQAGWTQLVDFVMAGIGITKPAAGMVEDSSYSTLFATLKQLYWLTLDPYCNDFASDFTRYLAPFFGDDLIVEIRPKRIDDHEVAIAKVGSGTQGKYMTKNEARKELGFPVTQEEWGNDILGDPSPNEKAQQEQQAQQQQEAGGPGQPPQAPGLGANEQGKEKDTKETAPSPPEVEKGRPNAGKPMQGSKGPMKSLEEKDRLRKALNGHARTLKGNHRSLLKV